MVRNMKLTSDEWKIVNKLPLLTKVPTLYVYNVNYRDLKKDGTDGSNSYTRQLRQHMSVKEASANVITMSLQLEREMIETSNMTENELYNSAFSQNKASFSKAHKKSEANIDPVKLEEQTEIANISDSIQMHNDEIEDSEEQERKLNPESYKNYRENFGLAEYSSQMGDLIKFGCSIMKSKKIYSILGQTASA
jgi:ribosome-binding ATPase YchF (GTP1/OBG family)